VRSSDESLRVERSTKLEPKPPNQINAGARVAASFEIARSSHWPKVVKRYLVRQPLCVCCAVTEALRVSTVVTLHTRDDRFRRPLEIVGVKMKACPVRLLSQLTGPHTVDSASLSSPCLSRRLRFVAVHPGVYNHRTRNEVSSSSRPAAAMITTSQVLRVSERYRLRYREEEVPIHHKDFVIGRAPDSQLRLDCGLVSRRHVRLRHCEAGLVLEDLGSRNGVLVNQRRVSEPVLLTHGDVIVVGVESLEFVDSQVLHLPANLSTLPPPQIPVETADMRQMESVTQPVQTSLLSVRERQVLELIALGHTQREIAKRLCIGVKTIETHRARIAEKLGCHSRAELVTYAITAGILRGR